MSVLSRANINIIGTCYGGYLVPKNKRITALVKVSNYSPELEKQKLLVRITDYENLSGVADIVLGADGENDSEIRAIIYENGFYEEFMPQTLKEAEELVFDDDLRKRKDFRNLKTITIDGKDARDLDDAVSFEKTETGYRLYVHIADVSHYVREGGAIDGEALKRGTSVYFPGLVLPMLPEKLSNDLCSLNPNTNKLTISTVMDIDNNGNVTDYKIYESVISSDYRMNYDDVNELILHTNSKKWDEYIDVKEMLLGLFELTKVLRKKRFTEGSINFDVPETKIIMKGDGSVLSVEKTEQTFANFIIEECMLLCNRTVAEYAFWAEVPFAYRTHEKPSKEKTRNFYDFLFALGYREKGELSNNKIAHIQERFKNAPEQKAISAFLLRSMMKAKYLPACTGHFGLGYQFYCHFTSPIRRYPDLICHRGIKELINGRNPYKIEEKIDMICEQSSEREQAAETAERDADSYEICKYMKKFVGQEFKAVITMVTSYGFFVELENTAEGLVRVDSISGDYYVFDKERYMLYGEKKGRTYAIGDNVNVVLVASDAESRNIDFVLKKDYKKWKKEL